MMWPMTKTFEGNPFAGLNRMQRELDRVFNNTPMNYNRYPAVNVYADNEELCITAEIPGFEKEDIQITLNGDQLTLEGERKAEELKENTNVYLRERGADKFKRAFKLPYKAEHVTATYKNGVLTITIPKAEDAKPKKIDIQ